jgi:hypothetical protein
MMDLPTPAHLALSGVVLLWDIVLAGRIAQLRRLPRTFVGATAIVGLLLAPALLIEVASASILNGRTIYGTAVVWPITLLLFALQAAYASARGLVVPLIGVPIAAYDIVLAVAAATQWATSLGWNAPRAALAVSAAHATALGFLTGAPALFSPFVRQLPILAPAYPSRWRLAKTFRVALAMFAAASAGLTGIELLAGYQAVRSYDRFAGERLQERPAGDFAVGLRVFPDLDGGPPPLAIRNDLDLADTLDVDAVLVVLEPQATRTVSLDSLGRAVDELRRDSTLLLVALGYERDAAERYRRGPGAYTEARLTQVDRITRQLRPDYLLPAHEPYGQGARALGRLPVDYWTGFLSRAAERVHRVRPRTRVAVAAASYDARDSALYAWAVSRQSGLDAVGFTFFPSFGGGASLDARMRAAARWMRAAAPLHKEHWVFAAGGYPETHGEASQSAALWGTLAWATRQTAVRGLIVATAGDYEMLTGLRVAGGRVRPAADVVARAVRGLRETAGQ